jgi:hypothetical protein
MKKTFIKTKNVKRFITLMDELQKLPPNIPKLALVYGDHGLEKPILLYGGQREMMLYMSGRIMK